MSWTLAFRQQYYLHIIIAIILDFERLQKQREYFVDFIICQRVD